MQRLGLTGALQRTLRTTNIIIQRWVASALVEAEKRFRRVRCYRDLQNLVGALDALAPPDGMVAHVA